MVFAHEFLVKPCDDKYNRKKYYPEAPPPPEKSMFYNRTLSQSFGNRFSFEKFKNNAGKNQKLGTGEEVNKNYEHVLVKKKRNWK